MVSDMLEVLWEEIDHRRLDKGEGQRTSNLLAREGIVLNGDIALRSEDELRDIRQFGKETMRKVLEYIAFLGLGLRHPDEPVTQRLQNLYGHVDQMPVSCLSIATSSVGGVELLELIQSGIRSMGDLRKATPEQIARCVGFSVDSTRVVAILSGRQEFFRLIQQ